MTISPQHKDIDWMGRWYEILKERGENDRPSLAKINLATQEEDWLDFSHAQMDGVGAITKYYLERGIQLTDVPELKEKNPPNFLESCKALIYFFTRKKNLKMNWHFFDPSLKPSVQNDFEWKIFSSAESAAIEKYCKDNKISLVAFLMHLISLTTLKHLSKDGRGTWTLPVNLRPVLAKNNFYSNHSSGILVDISSQDNPSSIHQKIKNSLKNKEHWCVWWAHQIGRYLGMNAMRKISLKNSQKNFLIGTFSYLSVWNLPKDDIWIGIPPGSKNFPISAFMMKANHQISLCLKIHPSILPHHIKTETIFKELITGILQKVG